MIDPSDRGLLRILGPLEAWTGQEWTPVKAAKWRALLASLLLAPGRLASTDQIIDDLWGDRPPARASNQISVYVHHLRRLIGDTNGKILVTRSPGYQIVLGPGDLDADRFGRLAADGQAALAAGDHEAAAGLLSAALGLWRGRALADVPPTPLVSAEADRLEWSRIQALELRIEADLHCGRHAEVVTELRRLLADHPLRERLWALRMQALAGAGRQAEALEVYADASEVIAAELGVDPGPELQQLHQDILNADAASAVAGRMGDAPAELPGPPPPAPAQLPADIPDFTGRAGQVDELCGLLSAAGEQGSPGAVPVVLVMGSGGLGKTTLAVHAAHLLAQRFGDGQLYASLLGATEPADPGEILA
ncbi:MAG TPA: hypothetical protein DHU96_26665, partial [Actinobacteria bacterium]|nr:hypothetical protein [Actinomycetota bacterium]